MDVRTITRRFLERIPFTRRAAKAVERAWHARALLTGVFDEKWYAEQTGVKRPAPAAAWHYLSTGRRQGLSPNPLSEPAWVDPEAWGQPYEAPERQGRPAESQQSPHPLVDLEAWGARHPEAASFDGGPLAHLIVRAPSDEPLPRAALPADGPRFTPSHVARLSRDHLRSWREGQRLVHAPRVQDTHDAATDAAFVRRWEAAPLPSTEGPLVTVVMPVLNRATTVLAAIASVRAQTLTNWELVVVDDGSTDATPEVVERIAADDDRIRLVRTEGGGVSRARNVGHRLARGRYVAWLDSDNVWVPHFLRVAVAAMTADAVPVAYAQSELVSSTRRRWRALDGGADLLAVRNHVDLNVLVAERVLVDEVGGFDESLRRTVDYDLVWRLTERAPLVHLPFVGVVYDDDEDTTSDRITQRELFSWKEVVRSKHLVDWEGLRAGPRVHGLTSVVVVARNGWGPAWTSVLSALEESRSEADVEIVVVDSALRRSDGAVLSALVHGLDRVKLVRLPEDGFGALSANVGMGQSTGDVVVVVGEGVRGRTGWLAPLREALDLPDTGSVQPLVLAEDGSVVTAGGLAADHARVPARLLQGMSEDDARRLPRHVRPAVADASVVAVRADDLIAVDGLDALYVGGWEVADLSLRLREAGYGTAVTAVDSVVVAPTEPPTRARARSEVADRRLFATRWQGRLGRRDDGIWAATGFDVMRYAEGESGGVPPALRRPSAVLAPGLRVTAEGVPALRWAIKTATPAGDEAVRWGDHHFAHALAVALERLGQQVVVDNRTAQERPPSALDDVLLALRGLYSTRYEVGSTNLLWVISHPELVGDAELTAPEAVFAASTPWARRATQRCGRQVLPLLQATDPERFNPQVADPGTGDPVLFVGNSRGVYRSVVRHLVEAGVPMAVYGGGWERFLPQGVLHGTHVANSELPARYRAAGVVLNDHWTEMREEGFMSNRLFDAAAVGARVVSDPVEGAEELFPGVVRTFRDPAHLVDLIREPHQWFGDDDARRDVADMVGRDHSFDARARTLLDTVLRLRA